MRTWLQLWFLVLTLVGVFAFAGNAEAWCPFGGVEGGDKAKFTFEVPFEVLERVLLVIDVEDRELHIIVITLHSNFRLRDSG